MIYTIYLTYNYGMRVDVAVKKEISVEGPPFYGMGIYESDEEGENDLLIEIINDIHRDRQATIHWLVKDRKWYVNLTYYIRSDFSIDDIQEQYSLLKKLGWHDHVNPMDFEWVIKKLLP